MAIAIMLNNFIHDFAVAILFASLMIMSLLYRYLVRETAPVELVGALYKGMTRVIIGAWVWIIIGGAVRTWAYKDYEWIEAAGNGQVAALVVKHILLVGLVVWGLIIQIRLKRLVENLGEELPQ